MTEKSQDRMLARPVMPTNRVFFTLPILTHRLLSRPGAIPVWLCLFCLLLGWLIPSPAPAAPAVDPLLSLYQRLDEATHGGQGYSQFDSWDKQHTGCIPCWAQSRVLDSYLEVYSATGDPKWLAKFAAQAEGLPAKTDRRLGRRDYRGVAGPAWSTIHYTRGRSHVWVAHTGLICAPLLEFARLVRERNLTEFSPQAELFLAAAREAVAFHDDQYSRRNGLAGYSERPDAPCPLAGQYLPWNQQAAMGRALLLLWRLTGREDYRTRAGEIAASLKGRITFSEDHQRCRWPYWTRNPPAQERMDDLNHATLVMRFMLDAFQAELVFTKSDLQCLANTLLHDLLRPNGEVAGRLDGTKICSHPVAALLWLPLGRIYPRVHHRLQAVYAADPGLLGEPFPAEPDQRGVVFQALSLLISLSKTSP